MILKRVKNWIPAFAGMTLGFLSLSHLAFAGIVRVQNVDGKSVEALPNQVLVLYKPGTGAAAKSRMGLLPPIAPIKVVAPVPTLMR